MKRSIVFFLLLLTGFILRAESFNDLMLKADREPNVSLRYAVWDQAAAAGSPAEKTKAWQTAFTSAGKTNDKPHIVQYGLLLKDCKELTDSERAEAFYQALSNQDPAQVKPEDWEAFLAMPGKNPSAVANARFAQSAALRSQFHTKAAMAVLESVRTGKEFDLNTKVDATLKLAQILFDSFRNREALTLLEQMEKEPELTPRRRAELTMLIGKSILQGYGYYPNLADADYEKAYSYLKKASLLRTSGGYNHYMSANFCIIQSLYTRGKYAETLKLCNEVFNNKKVKVDLGSWRALKTYMGQCKTQLGDYEGAIADFEALRDMKFEPFDNCRYLGYAYYLNRQYSLALGCFDEALKALEGCEDDRPVWCKQWIARIRWFTTDNNGEKLQKALAEYEGKTGSTGMARKTAKKKIQTVEDINAQTGDLAEDGLDMGF